MFKKTTLLLLALLCGTFCVAQKSIDAQSIDYVVRYVQAKYLHAYIASNVAETWWQHDGFQKCQKCSLSNPKSIPSDADIKRLCKDFNFGSKCSTELLRQMAATIRTQGEAVKKMSTTATNAEKIDTLLSYGDKAITDKIKQELSAAFPTQKAQSGDSQASSDNNRKGKKKDSKSSPQVEEPTEPQPDSVEIQKGSCLQTDCDLTVVTVPEDYVFQHIQWETSNPKKVEIIGSDTSATCKVRHLKGKATITVTVDGKTASIKIGKGGFWGKLLCWMLVIGALWALWRNRGRMKEWYHQAKKNSPQSTPTAPSATTTSLDPDRPKEKLKHEQTQTTVSTDSLQRMVRMLQELSEKVEMLTDKVSSLERRVNQLERQPSK